MDIPTSCQGFTIGVHFEYADALYGCDRLAHLSYPGSHGVASVQHATANVLRLRPTACVLKLTSIYGELVGYAPGGMA
jgi:hypothetical protein